MVSYAEMGALLCLQLQLVGKGLCIRWVREIKRNMALSPKPQCPSQSRCALWVGDGIDLKLCLDGRCGRVHGDDSGGGRSGNGNGSVRRLLGAY